MHRYSPRQYFAQMYRVNYQEILNDTTPDGRKIRYVTCNELCDITPSPLPDAHLTCQRSELMSHKFSFLFSFLVLLENPLVKTPFSRLGFRDLVVSDHSVVAGSRTNKESYGFR